MGVYSYSVNRQPKVRYRRRFKQRELWKSAIAGLSIVIVLLFMGYGLVHQAVTTTNDVPLIYEPIVVSGGDSLWTLAGKTGINQDKRILISKIMNYNALVSTTIYPGQVLYIPMPAKQMNNNKI